MIEYTSPMPKGAKDVDIYLEPDGTLSFEWHKGKIMSDKKIDFGDLRARLHVHEPRPYQGGEGWTIIDMFAVVDQLLTVIEAQDARIKALEDRLDAKDDQDTEGWAHSEYKG